MLGPAWWRAASTEQRVEIQVRIEAHRPRDAVEVGAVIQLGTTLPPIVQSTHDRTVGALEVALGPARFGAAWAAGLARSLDEAIAEALGDVACADCCYYR